MDLQENLKNRERPLCATGCGFYGSVETQNLCSKCYKDFQKQELAKTAKANKEPQEVVTRMDPTLCANGCGFLGMMDTRNMCSKCYNGSPKEKLADTIKAPVMGNPMNSDAMVKGSTSMKNRCKNCSKKVGLTGFECRCGNLFCGSIDTQKSMRVMWISRQLGGKFWPSKIQFARVTSCRREFRRGASRWFRPSNRMIC